MKIVSHSQQPKGGRKFTDREGPRAAFWKKYNQVKAELREESNVHVLTYYGVGGIGKSSLLKQLILEMNQEIQKPRYAYFDLNLHQDSRGVLTALKDSLIKNCKFSFPLFELGSYIYAKKIGEKADSPQIRQLTEKSPTLSLILEIMGSIPVVDFAAKIFAVADKSQAMLRTYLKNHPHELNRIEVLDQDELIEYLPELFAQDLAHNVENGEEPLVILLDTYERLVNELSPVGESLLFDRWLWGENGIMLQVPNTLWVIAGREKLKWERFDPDWAQALEQHLLGDLSQQDSDLFLCTAGILDPQLRQQMYELTHGTPVYLNLCLDQYMRYRQKDIQPDISMFGSNTYELVQRFVRDMDGGEKDMVYMLSCLQKWDDDLIWELGEKLLPGFSLSLYEKTKELSFVIQSEDSSYNLHQTVGSVLLQHCPKMLKQRVCDALIRHFEEKIPTLSPSSDAYTQALEYMLHGLILLYPERDALREAYDEKIKKPLNGLQSAGRLDAAEALLNILAPVAAKNKLDLLYAGFLSEKAWLAYRKRSNPHEGRSHASNSVILHSLLLGKEDDRTISSIATLGSALSREHLTEDAQELKRVVWFHSKAHYGEDHRKTIVAASNLIQEMIFRKDYNAALPIARKNLDRAENNLAHNDALIPSAISHLGMILMSLGQMDEAEELLRESLERRKESLGPENLQHPEVAVSMAQLATLLNSRGKMEEALDLSRKSLQIREKTLGNKHPTTVVGRTTLASRLEKAGKLEEALVQWKILLGIYIEEYGQSSFGTVQMYRRVVGALDRLGRQEEAEPLRSKTKWDYRVLSQEPETPEKENETKEYYTNEWRNSAGLIDLADELRCVWKREGPTHPDTIKAIEKFLKQLSIYRYWDILIPIGDILLPQLFEEALAQREDVVRLYVRLVDAVRASQIEKSIQWAITYALPILRKFQNGKSQHLRDVLNQLCADYFALGKLDQVQCCLAELYALDEDEN